MDLSFSPAEEAFRQEVRDFIDENFTPDMREVLKKSPTSYLDPERQRIWQKSLYEKGWAAPKWPVEYGGTGWTAAEHYIYETEIAAAGAPRSILERRSSIELCWASASKSGASTVCSRKSSIRLHAYGSSGVAHGGCGASVGLEAKIREEKLRVLAESE